MRRRSRQVLAGLVLAVAAVVAVASSHQQLQRPNGAGAEPEVSVSAPASPGSSSTEPSPLPEAPPAVPATQDALVLPQGEPTGVRVFSAEGEVKVEAALQPVTTNQRDQIAPPFGVAGWYAQNDGYWSNQKPGMPGPSIVAGHVTSREGPDVFWRLYEVVQGDLIEVSYDSGDEVQFVVTRSEAVDKQTVVDMGGPIGQDIWTPSGDQSVIRLITCDAETPVVNNHHTGNWVVWGERIM